MAVVKSGTILSRVFCMVKSNFGFNARIATVNMGNTAVVKNMTRKTKRFASPDMAAKWNSELNNATNPIIGIKKG